MLHKAKVARAIYWNSRRRLRAVLGLKPRPLLWQAGSYESALRHHTELVQRFLESAPAAWDFKGKTVCEVGCSDCLAMASLLIARGAVHVDLVEPSPLQLNPLQAKLLKSIQQAGFQVDPTILQAEGEKLRLDERRLTCRNCFMEALDGENRYDYLFSFDVMEHVEELDGFYGACRRVLKPGGQMFHSIDFSGHSEFEDPVPPLDFQTYPDWVFNLMYPRFNRVTRSFTGDHHEAIRRAGLVVDETRVTRQADPAYLEAIWPRLRPKARSRSREELGALVAVIVAHKG